MNKPTALLLIVLLSPLLGGMYGILHDQITYTISHEYYTKFKFIQFGIESWGMGVNIGTPEAPEIELQHPRVGVAIVGFLATWWVGLFIGCILGPVGLIHRDGGRMFRITMKAVLITVGVALSFGLAGLLYGSLVSADLPHRFLPDNLANRTSFIMVGSMHNFSYLGGVIGMMVGLVYSIRQRKGDGGGEGEMG